MPTQIQTVSEYNVLETPPEVSEKWSEIPDRDRAYGVRTAWIHEETGLVVRVKYQRRPTQMHTPETSQDDTGYIAEAESDDHLEQITYSLCSESIAYKRAYELLLNFPEGDFEPESVNAELFGPRSLEDWFE